MLRIVIAETKNVLSQPCPMALFSLPNQGRPYRSKLLPTPFRAEHLDIFESLAFCSSSPFLSDRNLNALTCASDNFTIPSYLYANPDYLRDGTIANSRTLIDFLSILTAHSVNGFAKNISTTLDGSGNFAARFAFFTASVSSISST